MSAIHLEPSGYELKEEEGVQNVGQIDGSDSNYISLILQAAGESAQVHSFDLLSEHDNNDDPFRIVKFYQNYPRYE
jgi:hypothetical protein